ncbi:hypothetical protein Q3G72_009841 [Acer saccharum]|nr:hypothetical protein Q3G72_009841 [Acer saccharum]
MVAHILAKVPPVADDRFYLEDYPPHVETRAREWLFSLEEGQWMAVESSKAAYLIMFLFDTSHDNISMDDIQVTSSLTGPITIEDVAYENSDPYSHLRN